jgi:hypothetical protein
MTGNSNEAVTNDVVGRRQEGLQYGRVSNKDVGDGR